MEEYPTKPMLVEEIELIKAIFVTRLRFFLLSFLIVFVVEVASFSWLITRIADAQYHNGGAMWFVVIISVLLLFVAFGSFMRGVYPYYQDYKTGIKEGIPFVITFKVFFPLTNQYFISLNDPAYLHYEVTEAIYNDCWDGDDVVIYRAPKSKYMFNLRDSFGLM